jgi:hypothetical protein
MLKILIAAMLIAATPLATAAPAGNIWPPRNYDPGVLAEWNALLVESVPTTIGGLLPRYYAVMHIAMYDAVSSIERDHPPMHVRVRAARHASTDAAAAQAAHDVLAALLPEKKAAFAAVLAKRLATINPARAELGVQVGREVARQVLAWRSAPATS